jgi:hypothetical protein
MQTDPTARHSPIGSFQRVCYLVHLARTAGWQQPLGRDHQHSTLIVVMLDGEGQTEVAVDLSGVGRFPKAFGAKLAHQPGSMGWAGALNRPGIPGGSDS